MALTEEVEHELVSYHASNLKEFHKCGIYNLVDRWIKVLGSNGANVSD